MPVDVKCSLLIIITLRSKKSKHCGDRFYLELITKKKKTQNYGVHALNILNFKNL